jgi:hypothetical protein
MRRKRVGMFGDGPLITKTDPLTQEMLRPAQAGHVFANNMFFIENMHVQLAPPQDNTAAWLNFAGAIAPIVLPLL